MAQFQQFTLLTDPNEYHNKYQMLNLQCVTCGSVQAKSLKTLVETPKCFVCHPKESKGQLELYEFVKSLAPDAVLSDRSMLPNNAELDVYVPSCKLGIEYDGLYWHSVTCQSNVDRAQKKMSACNKLGIRLFVVYEDEWRDKRHIVEAMVRHRLSAPATVYDARKLTVSQLTTQQARNFLNVNHLDGYTPSTAKFGLIDSTAGTVAALTLRRPIHGKYQGTLEVARCCSLVGASVRGWLGKLTKHASTWASTERGVKQLMTYVDGRVGQGVGYTSAGWQLVNATTYPRFWWTDYVDRYDRFKFRADKSRNMTEQQVADEAGVVRIYGCPNSLFFYWCTT